MPLGPVVSTPARRLAFFVLPGAAAKVPELLRRLGWPPDALDLVVRGEGDWVAAPPTRMGSGGCAQWARRPTAANRWLPDARGGARPARVRLRREAAAAPAAAEPRSAGRRGRR